MNLQNLKYEDIKDINLGNLKIECTCPNCKKKFYRTWTRLRINKNRKIHNQFCSKKCYGKYYKYVCSSDEAKLIKYFYDAFLRQLDYRKKKMKIWSKISYEKLRLDPKKVERFNKRQITNRNKNKDRYLEYAKKHKAKSRYGKFWESSMILNKLSKIKTNGN